MPTPRAPQISSWSVSRLGDYDQCPLKAKLKIIDKLKEPDSAAGTNGTRVHALAAMWVTGKMPELDKSIAHLRPEFLRVLKTKKIPPELDTFEEEFKVLRRVKALTEQQWCFDKDWQPVSWFGPQAWLRMKVDQHHLSVVKRGVLRTTTVEIVDYKTGKQHEDHRLQRSLYALGAFLTYPDAAAATAAHWYLDAGIVGGDGKGNPQRWECGQLEELKKEWVNRTKAMLNDRTFAPRPGEYCRWCAFSKAKGGPCKF